MKAILTTPDVNTPLRIAEVEEAKPEANQTLVQIRASTINRGEIALIRSRTNGWRPGQDLAGVVLRQAADGSGPKEGARVVGFAEQASWSERFAIDSARLGTLPDSVSFEEAATLPASAMTALRTLRFGGMLIGKRVLITGAAGAVGLFAVELAVRSGASVTALISREADRQIIEQLQPDEVVVAPNQIRGSFDVAIEAIGGEVFEKALASIAPGGVLVPFGNVSGKSSPFNAFSFVGHEGARIQSFLSYAAGPVEAIGEDLTLLANLVESGQLHPHIAETFQWENASNALAKVANGNSLGKVVLQLS